MRKFIDIVEFQMHDVESLLKTHDGDGGLPPAEDGEPWGRGSKVNIFDIVWDVGPEEEAILPKTATTTVAEVEDEFDPYADEEDHEDMMKKIGYWLQQTYHPGLSNFDYHIVY